MVARAPRGLTGNRIELSKVSAGDLHNALMAAAREPEVSSTATARFGWSEDRRAWHRNSGVFKANTLHSAEDAVLPDRIETGTYAMAAAITGGDAASSVCKKELQLGRLASRSRCGPPASVLRETAGA